LFGRFQIDDGDKNGHAANLEDQVDAEVSGDDLVPIL
jgi:hypothetical protein